MPAFGAAFRATMLPTPAGRVIDLGQGQPANDRRGWTADLGTESISGLAQPGRGALMAARARSGGLLVEARALMLDMTASTQKYSRLSPGRRHSSSLYETMTHERRAR